MTQEIVEVVDIESSQKDHRFFDPRSPERPADMLGMDTDAVLRLGRAATALGVLNPEINKGLNTMPTAIRVLPLVEKLSTDKDIGPEDIRPYRKPIKKLSFWPNTADKLAAGAGALAIGIPLRRAINRKVENDFPARAAEMVENARENLASLEHEVDFIASFDDPKAEFVKEIAQVAEQTHAAIVIERNLRVQSGMTSYSEPEVKGFMGVITKIVRSIKSFFGFFSRKSHINEAVTAYDAGSGIDKTFTKLMADRQTTARQLPMLSRFLVDKLPGKKLPSAQHLAFVAPEILASLFSALPKKAEYQNMLESVQANPHELRFITAFKKHYKQFDLESIQYATRTLLPAIRDVLPSEGSKAKEVFNRVKTILESPRWEAYKLEHKQKQAERKKLKSEKKRSRLFSWFGQK